MAKKLVRRLGCGLGLIILLLAGFLFLTEQGRAVFDLATDKRIREAASEMLSEKEMRQYNATTESNLRAIHTALMMYHDSEGQFPQAEGWMDAIWTRLLTSDMEGSESEKKLKSPSVQGADQYGYAMNDKAAGKYKDDLDPKMPLVFDSKDTKKNAHGDPKALAPAPARAGKNLAITVDGTLTTLSLEP